MQAGSRSDPTLVFWIW